MNKKIRCSQCKQRHIDFSDTIKLDKDGNPYNNACRPVSIDILMINARMESKLRRFINKIIRGCLNTLKFKKKGRKLMGKIGHYLAGLDWQTIAGKVVDDLQEEVMYNSDPKVIANASSQEAIVMKARLGLAQQTLDRIDRLTAL